MLPDKNVILQSHFSKMLSLELGQQNICFSEKQWVMKKISAKENL